MPPDGRESYRTKRSLPQSHADVTSNRPAKRSRLHNQNHSTLSQIPDDHRQEVETLLLDLSLGQLQDLLVQATWMHRDIDQAARAMRDSSRFRRSESHVPDDIEQDRQRSAVSLEPSVNDAVAPISSTRSRADLPNPRSHSESRPRSSSQLRLSRSKSESASPSSIIAELPPHSPRTGTVASQIADQPRIPWVWIHAPHKFCGPYLPTVVGKWWYRTAEQLEELDRNNHSKRKNWNHIGRIMETDLGQRHEGDDRCARCIENGYECWTYTLEAEQQILQPGSRCVRCRVASGSESSHCRHSKSRIHRDADIAELSPTATRP
ncbi:hypothetical protein N431DRAFT_433686 [Stipitochalara longipes BDJ]|nr:hypothetical protein N431DRAFT_433686 [Stipitochalara longipes BDJ]